MIEEWRPVVGYEGLYEVSSLGRIKSLHSRNKGKIRALKTKRKGYLAVTLSREGKRRTVTVHQLVARAFVPNPNNLSEVNHLNEDKTDNRVENLCWSTRRENVLYGSRGARQSATFKARGYLKIGVICTALDDSFLAEYSSLSEAAKATGADISHISKCCRGKLHQTKGLKFRFKSVNATQK